MGQTTWQELARPGTCIRLHCLGVLPNDNQCTKSSSWFIHGTRTGKITNLTCKTDKPQTRLAPLTLATTYPSRVGHNTASLYLIPQPTRSSFSSQGVRYQTLTSFVLLCLKLLIFKINWNKCNVFYKDDRLVSQGVGGQTPDMRQQIQGIHPFLYSK